MQRMSDAGSQVELFELEDEEIAEEKKTPERELTQQEIMEARLLARQGRWVSYQLVLILENCQIRALVDILSRNRPR